MWKKRNKETNKNKQANSRNKQKNANTYKKTSKNLKNTQAITQTEQIDKLINKCNKHFDTTVTLDLFFGLNETKSTRHSCD